MPSKPRTHFDREALSDGKASTTRAKESENQLHAEELAKAGLEHEQQIRETAHKDKPLYIAHV